MPKCHATKQSEQRTKHGSGHAALEPPDEPEDVELPPSPLPADEPPDGAPLGSDEPELGLLLLLPEDVELCELPELDVTEDLDDELLSLGFEELDDDGTDGDERLLIDDGTELLGVLGNELLELLDVELPELTELLGDEPELPDDEDEPELPELPELDDEPDDLLELLPLLLLLLDEDPDDLLDDDRLNDERLEKLLGTLKIVGLIGPINGMPACGSGI